MRRRYVVDTESEALLDKRESADMRWLLVMQSWHQYRHRCRCVGIDCPRANMGTSCDASYRLDQIDSTTTSRGPITIP